MNNSIICHCDKKHQVALNLQIRSIAKKDMYRENETIDKGIEISLIGLLAIPDHDNELEPAVDVHFSVSLFINEDNIKVTTKIPEALLGAFFRNDAQRVIDIIKNFIDTSSELIDAIIEEKMSQWKWGNGDFFGKENIANVTSTINKKIADICCGKYTHNENN